MTTGWCFELGRNPRVADEANVTGGTLVGRFISASVVVGAYGWWLLIGKRFPGRLGSWVRSLAWLSFGSILRRPPDRGSRSRGAAWRQELALDLHRPLRLPGFNKPPELLWTL